ncbi:MAG: type II toxin-antitoxin system RelE/ParE family toxin [Thermoanaerobaculia bacterium]
MRLELHPDAQAEFRLAALWYEEHRAGLGDEFVTEVSTTLHRIVERPAAYPVWPETRDRSVPIRKAVVDRFPYLIGFEAHSDRILVLAVAHAKRSPLYWLARAAGGSEST